MRRSGDAAIPLPREDIEILAGNMDLFRRRTLSPYDERVCTFLHSLSRALMNDAAAKAYPDIMTFAYFCRNANIKRMQLEFEQSEPRLRRGRGTIFHVAPSNVPVNFAYSYLFALLAGCSSIVRVSSSEYAQIQAICRVLNETLDLHNDILSMTLILRYEHNDSINSTLSSLSDGRIIWGGDSTVLRFRAYPAKPRCVDIAFPDRYSLCLIKSDAIDALSDAELGNLAKGFYNDTYLMDQNACSSPHLVLWSGENPETAQKRFWAAVSEIARKKYEIQPVIAVDKLTRLHIDAVSGSVSGCVKYGNVLYVSELIRIPERLDEFRGVGGYFYQYKLEKTEALFDILSEKCQTLTYFGFEQDELRSMLESEEDLNLDRAALIGQALELSAHWDGYDIVRELSRTISII